MINVGAGGVQPGAHPAARRRPRALRPPAAPAGDGVRAPRAVRDVHRHGAAVHRHARARSSAPVTNFMIRTLLLSRARTRCWTGGSGGAGRWRSRATARMRIVSGSRPTGRLHLGHLLGALTQLAARCRTQAECFFFVADWHALTTGYEDTGGIRASTRDMVLDWLAVGLDPEHGRALRPVGGEGARRAAPAAVDDRSDAVAAAQPDHQGAGARARPDRSDDERDDAAQLRAARLSGAAGGRHPALPRARRAGRHRPGAAPRAHPRGRAALQPPLRRGVSASPRRCSPNRRRSPAPTAAR